MGSFIFIIIQLILLIDFAYSWNKVWVGNAEDGDNKGWFAGTRLKSIYFIFFLNQVIYMSLLLVVYYIEDSDLQMY